MIYIETGTTKPQFNLATEEYLLRKGLDTDETIVLLWRNSPAVIIGAFQNTAEEINTQFVKENNIQVVRRMSGGGAVYHDLGNLCFSFILKKCDPKNVDYSFFLTPVIDALSVLGVKAEVSGRNDLLVCGRKISGSAVRILKDRMLFHGTLLYDTDLEVLSNALNVSADKISSKAVKSVRSRVTTIKEHLETDDDVLLFKQSLVECFFHEKGFKEYVLTEADKKEIEKLALEKYSSYDWNFGKNPTADIVFSKRFESGKVTAYITVKNQVIKKIRFVGDFLGCSDISDAESAFVTVPYENDAVEKVLEMLNIPLYFGNITKEQLLQVIMGS